MPNEDTGLTEEDGRLTGGGNRPGAIVEVTNVVMEVTDVVMEVTDEVMEVAEVAARIVPLAGDAVVSMGIDVKVPESTSLVEVRMVLMVGINWDIRRA